MKHLIKRFKALSDANRIRILKMLKIKPLCVCEITFVLGLAVSTVSKHLSILRDSGFISDKKDGKWVSYYLNRDRETVEDDLIKLIQKWMPDDDTLENDRKRMQKADRNQLCR